MLIGFFLYPAAIHSNLAHEPLVIPTPSLSSDSPTALITHVSINNTVLSCQNLASDAEPARGRYIYIQGCNKSHLTHDQQIDLLNQNVTINEYLGDGVYLCHCSDHMEAITFKCLRDLKYLSRADIMDPAGKTTPSLRRVMNHAADLPGGPSQGHLGSTTAEAHLSPGRFDIGVHLHNGAIGSDVSSNMRSIVRDTKAMIKYVCLKFQLPN